MRDGFFVKFCSYGTMPGMCQAEMFNKKAASAKSKPDEIIKALALKGEQTVLDFGAGGGYFALRFAEAGEAGYQKTAEYSFLPEQSFTIFSNDEAVSSPT